MNSLRIRLILLFGVAIVIAAILQFTASVQVAMNEANKLFDYHMQQMALALQDSSFRQVEWHTLQDVESGNFDFVVQVWAEDGAHVYEPHPYNSLPKLSVLGYSNVKVGSEVWRVYTSQARKRVIQIAQKITVRKDRAVALALSALWPVMTVSALLFFAAWWVVNSALAPINRIGLDLANRNADSTSQISDKNVPKEIALLVKELNALLERMSQALQAQQRFVADAAHELRSPVTALRLQVQNLGRSKDELTSSKAIDRLLGGVDRASRLIEQLLILARQDPTASKNVSLHETSLTLAVEQALNDVAPFAQSRQITLQSQLEIAAAIQGDGESLRVMVRNLLDNAVRYIPEQGEVHISLYSMSEGIILLIQDSGGGIPVGERNRIFDRFYRIPGTATNGSGLGLAIVKTIVDRHKAKIEIGDAELGGLEVKVRFPHFS